MCAQYVCIYIAYRNLPIAYCLLLSRFEKIIAHARNVYARKIKVFCDALEAHAGLQCQASHDASSNILRAQEGINSKGQTRDQQQGQYIGIKSPYLLYPFDSYSKIDHIVFDIIYFLGVWHCYILDSVLQRLVAYWRNKKCT